MCGVGNQSGAPLRSLRRLNRCSRTRLRGDGRVACPLETLVLPADVPLSRRLDKESRSSTCSLVNNWNSENVVHRVVSFVNSRKRRYAGPATREIATGKTWSRVRIWLGYSPGHLARLVVLDPAIVSASTTPTRIYATRLAAESLTHLLRPGPAASPACSLPVPTDRRPLFQFRPV